MTKNQYLAALLKARTVTDFNMAKSGKDITRALNKAYRDIIHLLDLSKPGSLTQANYLARKKAIERLLRDMMLNVKDNIYLGIKNNLETNVENNLKSTAAYIQVSGLSVGIESAFGGIPQKIGRASCRERV